MSEIPLLLAQVVRPGSCEEFLATMRRAPSRVDIARRPRECAALLRQLAAKPAARHATPTNCRERKANNRPPGAALSRSAADSDDEWADVDRIEYQRVVRMGKRLMRLWASGADDSAPNREEADRSSRVPVAVEPVEDVAAWDSDVLLEGSAAGSCQGEQGRAEHEVEPRETAAAMSDEPAAAEVEPLGKPLIEPAPGERHCLAEKCAPVGTQVSAASGGGRSTFASSGAARGSVGAGVGEELHGIEVLSTYNRRKSRKRRWVR